MKILFVFETIQKGGAEFLVLNICKNIIKNYKDIDINLLVFRTVSGDMSNEFKESGVKIHSLDLPQQNNLIKRLFTIKRMLIKINPDVVHCHSIAIDRDVLFVSWLLRIPGRFTTVHNMWLGKDLKSRINYFLASYTSNRVIAVSNAALDHYKKFKLYLRNKLKVIYNGYGLDNSQVKARAKFNDASNIQLINVGAFREPKGQIYLIKAMRILQDEKVPVHLTIYGEDRYDGYGGKLHEEAKGLNNVTFFGGTSDVQTAYEKCDIYVTSSVSEAMPITLLEAIGMGVPVVASDIAPHKEVLELIDDCVLVKSSSPESLAEGIKVFLNEPGKYKRCSESCLKASKIFDINETAENHLKLYKGN